MQEESDVAAIFPGIYSQTILKYVHNLQGVHVGRENINILKSADDTDSLTSSLTTILDKVVHGGGG